MSLFTRALLCMALVLLAGCASDGSLTNPFASPEPASGSSFYFGEFPDVPIPNDMSESRGDTFVTFAPSGIKCGVQRFTGRVEAVSLMNTMRRNMSSQGWILRSLMRSKESALVFEKGDRVATFQVTDGLIFTEMRVFVSSRLEGDSGAVDINAYSSPAKKSAASSGGSQKLSE